MCKAIHQYSCWMLKSLIMNSDQASGICDCMNCKGNVLYCNTNINLQQNSLKNEASTDV
jgi:hypothetical protein